jgi:hypothetical protein
MQNTNRILAVPFMLRSIVPALAGFDPSEYTVVRNVTKEFFVIPEDGTPMYLRFETAFAKDESIEIKTRSRAGDGDKKKEPMEIADVVNMMTGEIGRLIGNEVVKSELRGSYPEDSYIGKVFEIRQGASKTGRGGNKYRTFKIVEMVRKSDTAPAPAPAAAPAKNTGARK